MAEGNVGGGTGMTCFEFKGGIGTASRKLTEKQGGYTLGVLVQANFGLRPQLRVAACGALRRCFAACGRWPESAWRRRSPRWRSSWSSKPALRRARSSMVTRCSTRCTLVARTVNARRWSAYPSMETRPPPTISPPSTSTKRPVRVSAP